ncbi:hypothetical protein LMH87_002111 [Akanthomyces muscarius]|uniref:RBR-type E3 ubiquitin transferase n=1 Tax=Akanthomyces muscarius TaxID=2231603 RepID=A0A9W8Q665_AKAMU|nr:hypothetical protein LMH87_002111 [Akanthomyces muscarius]KAJ4147599.1 hypothetical protein LMH87_002111 [Akanthomyces muscarius]
MESLTITIHSPPKTPDTMAIGDVNHDVYAKEVLGLQAGITEDAVDADLVAKANSLGIAASTLQKRNTSSAFSCSTTASAADQTFSATSPSMPTTPHSSIFGRSSTDLVCSGATGFAQYDQFITAVDAPLEQVRFRKGSLPVVNSSAQSVFSVSTNKSFSSVKSGFKPRSWWKKKSDPSLSCHGCRSSSGKMIALHGLSCNHTYCSECLRYVVSQACTNEEMMPPRCCSKPFPSRVLKEALDRDTQQSFLKAVAHFSTPTHARIYCPNRKCGEFINPHQVTDHKHPFDVTCQHCLTRACRMCKAGSHAIGADCPEDWELEAVKKMGQSTSWKRCYSCHNLVNLPKGRTHITCRCKEELCHVCGGVWDATTGCPNLCGDEAVLEKRRSGLSSASSSEDQDEAAKQTAVREQAEKRDAERRSQRSPEVQDLVSKQALQLRRFCAFSARTRSSMQTRHATDKLALLERHVDEEDALRDKHAKATGALEDRQIAAEMELRTTLEQTQRSVNLRLKHMEAYCHGRSRSSGSSASASGAAAAAAAGDAAARVVTEKNLKELGQQYTLRDGMERQHEAKINVMRERQAKRMEELLDRHEAEVEALAARQRGESHAQASRCAAENEAVTDTLRMLQIRLSARWSLQLDVLCREREEAEGLRYGAVATPAWPQEQFYVEQQSS